MLKKLFTRKRLLVNIMWLLLIAFIVFFALSTYIFRSVDPGMPIGR